MATVSRIRIRNINRTPLRIGSVQVPVDGTPVFVDTSDAKTRQGLYRHVGRWVAAPLNDIRIAKVPLTGVAATTTGAVATWTNPESQSVIVTRVELDVTTQSTGAANLTTTQTGSATGTVAAAQAVGAVGAFGPVTTTSKLISTDGLAFTGSATTVGLVGNAYVHYHTV